MRVISVGGVMREPIKIRNIVTEKEAMLFTGINGSAVMDFMGDGNYAVVSDRYIEIKTLERTMRADSGDWIIKGLRGEFYPCKPDIFEKSYEPV